MRLNLSVILSLLFAVGLVAFGFTFYQSSTEKAKLSNELESRILLVTNEIFRSDSMFFKNINRNNINYYADSLNTQYNLLGLTIYYNSDSIISLSLIHISEPTRQAEISYAVFCLKK